MSSEGQSDEVWMRSVGEMIPQSIADDILELVINSEDHHCSQHYNLLLSPKIRKLKLEKYFDWLQSLLIEAATQCTNLQEIFISADVMDNCHDDIREFLNSVNSLKLKSLSMKIPSKLQSSVATESSLRTMFHNINVDNMSVLEHLDIAGINIDESCLQSILKMKKLKSLILNDCKMSTIQAVQILTGMSWLKQFECSYGKQSKVIQALSSLPRGTRLRLECLSFRSPPRPSFFDADVLRMVRSVGSVSVTWNIAEVGYSTAVDEGLARLERLEHVRDIRLEVEMINMLYIIQLGSKLENIAHKITRFNYYFCYKMVEPQIFSDLISMSQS